MQQRRVIELNLRVDERSMAKSRRSSTNPISGLISVSRSAIPARIYREGEPWRRPSRLLWLVA